MLQLAGIAVDAVSIGAVMPSQPKTLFFIKFFECQKYAEDFLDGHLYLNAVRTFRDMEDSVDGRADDHEGAFNVTQPHPGLVLKIGGFAIDPEDLSGPVRFYSGKDLNMNVLCLYAGSTGTFDVESSDNVSLYLSAADQDALKEHLRVPEACLAMGAHAVIIHNVQEFKKRVFAGAEREGARTAYKPVTYLPLDHSGRRDPVFDKPNHYSWQREHRFLLDFGRTDANAGPVRLPVGSLRDICTYVDSATINGSLRLESPFEASPTPP